MHVAKFRLAFVGIVTAITFATAGAGTAYADQVHMLSARNALQQAVSALHAARDDKGGHRVAAINFAQQAIDQVNQGIQHAGGSLDGPFPPPPRPWGPPMTSANGYLQDAVNELRTAEDDKAGHRVAAINLAQQAMDQVNQGIQIGGPL